MINEVDSFSELKLFLPKKCIEEINRIGRVDYYVKKWVDILDLAIPKEKCLEELKELGAWPDEELEDMNSRELNEYFLWMAATDD